MEEDKKKKSILYHAVLIILVVSGVFFGYKTYGILSEYYKAAKEYREIQEIAIKEVECEEESEEKNIAVNFEELARINPDIVAWIRFEEPSIINYPIVQGANNQKYLTTTFEGAENGAGCLYMDANNTGDFSDRNTFIYGHYKKNGHMFGSLGKYKDESYYKNHPFFDIYTPDGVKSRYRIFAVTVVDSDSDSYRKVYVNEEEYHNYLSMVKQLSLYETDVQVTGDASIVSLSTCTNVSRDERLLIHAVRINQSYEK